jgi:hypothetical protein
MQHVKYLKASPGILEGSIRQVDENSAKVLKERGTVEIIEPDKVDKARESAPPFPRTSRGNLTVTQIAEADLPNNPAKTSEETDGVITTGTGAGEPAALDAPGDNATKAELVAYASGKLTGDDGQPLSDAELEGLTKPELRAKLSS